MTLVPVSCACGDTLIDVADMTFVRPDASSLDVYRTCDGLHDQVPTFTWGAPT